MSDDTVTLLRILNHHAKKLAENESLHDLHRDAFTRCEALTWQASEEIMQLRQEVENLRAERDEARREVCESDTETHGGALLEAQRRGWDCFKEKP